MVPDKKNWRLWVWLMLCLASPFTATAQQAEPEPLKLGVFPYVTPVQLVKFHNPLRTFLQETLGRPVVLETAPSFPEFVARTRQARYDYVLTAPHLGRLAEVRDGHHPLVKTGHQVQGVYLVPKDSPIRTLADLEGKSIMMVGEAAILTQLAVHQLAGLGLRDGENLEIRRTRTHNNAMYASLRGDADVSLTGILLFEKIQLQEKEKVRVLDKTPGVPGFILLAAPEVPENERDKVRQALLGFVDRPESADYFKMTGFRALLPIDRAEMEALDPYIERWLDSDR